MGLGACALQTNQRRDTGSPAILAAVQGTSIDISSNVILGQAVGEVGDPAILSRPAEIPFSNDDDFVSFGAVSATQNTKVSPGHLVITATDGQDPYIDFFPTDDTEAIRIVNVAGLLMFEDSLTMTVAAQLEIATGNLALLGSLQTGSPPMGDTPGTPNYYGSLINGTFAEDPTEYWEVQINGNLRYIKLSHVPL